MQLFDLPTLLKGPDHQFEILKILLDKGALAILIALLGAAISILIERYKSALTRQVELSKITMPMITSMLDATEELFAANCAFIRDGAAEFSEFEAWVKSMLATRLFFKEPVALADLPHGANCRMETVSMGGSAVTIEDFLLHCSPSRRIEKLIQTRAFWNDDAVTGEEGSLVRQIYLAHMHGNTNSFFATTYFSAARIYANNRSAVHSANLRAQNRFRLLAMKNLYPINRAQKKALDAIIEVQSLTQDLLLDFPKGDAGREVGLIPKTTPTTYDQVVGCHGALITQLKRFLRAQ
jgi:hypothetical protein